MEPLSTRLLIGIFEPVCFIKSMKTHACKYWWNHNFFYQNVILCIRPKTAILILQSGNILKKQLKKYAECNVPHLSGPVGFTFSVIHVGWTLRAAMIFRPFLTERYMALCSLTTEGPPTPLTDYCFWNKHEHFEKSSRAKASYLNNLYIQGSNFI